MKWLDSLSTLKQFSTILFVMLLLATAAYKIGTTDGFRDGKASITIPEPVQLPAKTIEVPVEPKGVIISITLGDLEDDLKKNAAHLSSRERSLVLDGITKTAELYKISPLILYSIIKVETDYRFNINHKPKVIPVFKNGKDGKKIDKKISAIGGTGIVYELWGYKLRKAGIIETRNDLYDPQINILSCGFIFNELRTWPLKAGTTDPNVSAMRYYLGGNYKGYSDKIEAKIGSIILTKVYK